MSAPAAFVYVDVDGGAELAGSLWLTSRRHGTQASTFRYADSWLADPRRFAIDPLLPVTSAGPFHKDRLFGAIADSAPDRWGRTLIARAERIRATAEGRVRRTLSDLDFVLGVADLTRQGALRFAVDEGGDFLGVPDTDPVPPIIELPTLLVAARGFLADPSGAADLRILLAPGSSLGGARPKASVRTEGGSLAIAKFPRDDDRYSVGAWEHLVLLLAADAGIGTADSELITIDERQVLLLPRFDRAGELRIPFLSAMSLVDGVDGEARTYLEIADAIRRFGAQASRDLRELWRRIVFNVLVSNTDDHLRNHGFLYSGSDGWRLSPAYDVNPVPIEFGSRFLSTAIGDDPDDTSASLELAFEVAPYFDLEEDEARAIAREVAGVTTTWADRAGALGIVRAEIDLMRSAFEHEELSRALES